MGHVINPISYRLYNIRYWNNNWFDSNKSNYAYLVNLDFLLTCFIKRFFFLYVHATSIGVILINLKVLRIFNNQFLYIYIHDSFLDLLALELKKSLLLMDMRKFFKKRFIRKYKRFSCNSKIKKAVKKILKKKITFKYIKKLCMLFLKNTIIRTFWVQIKLMLTAFLSKINVNITPQSIIVLNLLKNRVNASIISEFFYVRLQQYYTIWEVLRNINFLFRSLMFKKKIVRGYKITCSGRFSRKQRTTYSWKVFGSLAPSSMKSNLDYNYRTIALKYSSCTIKVWVSLKSNNKSKIRTEYIV